MDFSTAERNGSDKPLRRCVLSSCVIMCATRRTVPARSGCPPRWTASVPAVTSCPPRALTPAPPCSPGCTCVNYHCTCTQTVHQTNTVYQASLSRIKTTPLLDQHTKTWVYISVVRLVSATWSCRNCICCILDDNVSRASWQTWRNSELWKWWSSPSNQTFVMFIIFRMFRLFQSSQNEILMVQQLTYDVKTKKLNRRTVSKKRKKKTRKNFLCFTMWTWLVCQQKIARRACYSWEFAGFIIFLPCLLCRWVFSRFFPWQHKVLAWLSASDSLV